MSAVNESGRSRPKSRFGDRRSPLILVDPSSDKMPQMSPSSPKPSLEKSAANGDTEPRVVVGLGHRDGLLDSEVRRNEAMSANGSMYLCQVGSDRCFRVLFARELNAFARNELGVSPTWDRKNRVKCDWS